VAGVAGTTEPQGTVQSALGGGGGNNGLSVIVGANTYGPYGMGGDGGFVNVGIDYYTEYFTNGVLVATVPHYVSSVTPGNAGSNGAVILYWGQ
jgi:hypothetical protein